MNKFSSEKAFLNLEKQEKRKKFNQRFRKYILEPGVIIVSFSCGIVMIILTYVCLEKGYQYLITHFSDGKDQFLIGVVIKKGISTFFTTVANCFYPLITITKDNVFFVLWQDPTGVRLFVSSKGWKALCQGIFSIGIGLKTTEVCLHFLTKSLNYIYLDKVANRIESSKA